MADEDLVSPYATDASGISSTPWAVLRVGTPRDVELAVRWAAPLGVPVVARGAGTGLAGECVPIAGGLVVDFSTMNRVLDVNKEDRLATVEPGVVNKWLNDELKTAGLFFPPNPGSWETSTIGGNISTNAAGPRSYKYGSTKNWVASVEVVTGRGETLRLGTKSRKSSSGLDLLHLIVGSEGTLGLITQATLRLSPVPERRLGVIVPISSIQQALQALLILGKTPSLEVSAIEFIDEVCVKCLNTYEGKKLPETGGALLMEVESTDEGFEKTMEHIYGTLSSIKLPAEPLVDENVDSMWVTRGRVTYSLQRRYGPRHREDLAVPLSRFPDLVRGLREMLAPLDVEPVLFGHAGDGNIHLEFDHLKLGEAEFSNLRRRMYELAVSMGGTISGEHGIGVLKRGYMDIEHSKAELALMREIKAVFDPHNILNPGKDFC